MDIGTWIIIFIGVFLCGGIIFCMVSRLGGHKTDKIKDLDYRLDSLETMYFSASDHGDIIKMPTKDVIFALLTYLELKPKQATTVFKLVKKE